MLTPGVRQGEYYYPTSADGSEGERTALPRPLKEGERMEIILLEGSPGEHGA